MYQLISQNLYRALQVAKQVYEETQAEGPTTLAIQLAENHKFLLDSVTDQEIIALSALIQGVERGKLFKAASAQIVASGQGGDGQPLGSPLGIQPFPPKDLGH
jgi:hypothetical protein